MKHWHHALILVLAAAPVCLQAVPAEAYKQNQTCDTDGGPRGCSPNQVPAPIAWDHSCVLFYLDENGSHDFPTGDDGSPGEELESIVRASFEAWNEPDCSGLQLVYGDTVNMNDEQPGERRNVVSFKNEDWPRNSASTFASTMINYHTRSGTIRDADIEVNDEFYTFGSSDGPRPGEADLQNTLTHEVGHLLGLGHTEVRAATMFGAAELGETKKRSLHRDDINGLCAQYPVEEYSSTCGGGGDTDDPLNREDGSGSFHWGDDEESQSSGCSVTGEAGSAILPSMLFMLALLGGARFRRRR